MEQPSVDGASIDVDAVFRALAARSRRRILTTLLETTDRTVQFKPLAEGLAAHDWAATLGVVTLELLHRDLPQLEAVGLVEFDARSETIVATDRLGMIKPLLDAARRVERALNHEV